MRLFSNILIAMLDIDWELMFRYCGDECTPEERARFERWLAADPRHREFFDAVVLGASRTLAEPQPTPPATALALHLEALHTPRRAPRPVPWHVGLAALGLAAAVVIAERAGLVDRLGGDRQGTVAERTLTTRAGERAQIDLSDGTRITLASASTVRYPVHLSGARRTVSLSGQAAFAVAHNTPRPFVVRAGGAVIQDVGTRFDVRAYVGDARVRVVVADGSVDVHAVDRPANPQRVKRGELGQLDAGGVVEIRAVDPARYLAWTDGRLVFDAAPMRDVAAQLGRWYGTPVVIADSALAGRDFTGAFNGEMLRNVLAVIAAAVHARVEWRGDTATLSSLPQFR